MDMRTSHRLKEGALVRLSWDTLEPGDIERRKPQEAIVIGKKYVKERHKAKTLGCTKEERYDVIVHWFPRDGDPPQAWLNGRHHVGLGRTSDPGRHGLKTHQNWELMLISSGS